MSCKHRWVMQSYTSGSAEWQCSRCKERTERDLTTKERKLIEAASREVNKEIGATHRVYAAVLKKLVFGWGSETGPYEGHPRVYKIVLDKIVSSRFRYLGYALILEFEKLQKKFPQILSAHVDDRNFMNSAVFLVPHESKKSYMGSTMFVVPQACDEPSEVFLYPSDVDGLLDVLGALRRKAKIKKELEDEGPAEKRLGKLKPRKEKRKTW